MPLKQNGERFKCDCGAKLFVAMIGKGVSVYWRDKKILTQEGILKR
jgi:hypothetical protein